MTLGTYNVDIDPSTGLPKAELRKQKRRELETKVNKVETIAHLLSQELQSEQGRLMAQTIYEKLVKRVETLLATDIESQALLSLLDALNVKLNIIPRMVKEEMEHRLPFIT